MQSPSAEPPTAVIEPPRRWPGTGLDEMWASRRILWVLARRLVMIRYRNTALGIAWVIIQPLLLTVLIAVFLGLLMGRDDRMGIPYPVFLFTAWVGWRVFTRVMSQGGNSIESNSTLIQRIYLPRVFLPLAVVLASLLDFFFMVVALLVLLAVYGISPGVGVVTVPVLTLIMYAAALGTAFIFSTSSLRHPDIDVLIPLLVQAWFWMSPVIYPSSIIPEPWRTLYYLNPMAVVIEGLRWAFAQSPVPPPEEWLLGSATAALLLVLGFVYFRKGESTISDLL
jgi:lipopolysaccharide transport system permease protein